MTSARPARLYCNLTSPYGRKVRVLLERLGLTGSVERIEPELSNPNDPLWRVNPLGKMPCLVLSNGTAVFDSRVIVDHLDSAYGMALIPADPASRTQALVGQALGDGIIDAALAMIMERLSRDESMVSEKWIGHQRRKVERGLAYAADCLPEASTLNIGALSLACALAYLDWRKPVDWRNDFPQLVSWFDTFRTNVPEFDRTF